MLKLSLFFLIISVISAILGFGGLIASAWIAEIIFYISLSVFVVLLITGLALKPPKVWPIPTGGIMNKGKTLTFISVITAALVSLFVKYMPKRKKGLFSVKNCFLKKNMDKMLKMFGRTVKRPSIYSRCMKVVNLRWFYEQLVVL